MCWSYVIFIMGISAYILLETKYKIWSYLLFSATNLYLAGIAYNNNDYILTAMLLIYIIFCLRNIILIKKKKMTNEIFERILNFRLLKIKQILGVKAKEYVRNDDRLHNFNVGASITNSNRQRVLDGFLTKHYISYRDMLDDIDKGNIPTEELVNEKFGDIINYFILQEACIKQTIQEHKEKLPITAKTE